MTKKEKKVAELSLETILWNCRNELRGIGGTDNKRDAVIGLVFLKFAGDKFIKRRAELEKTYGDKPDLLKILLDKPSSYLSENVFYLNETSRWEYIVRNANAENIAVIVDKAMEDIENANEPLEGALPQKFYVSPSLSVHNFKGLIDEVNKIDEKRFPEDDLIGRVYEYFLQAYAVAGDKEDGEFYTPPCAVKLIAELIEPYSGIVYDPCCGSGGMFVQSMKFVNEHNGNKMNVSIIGQEKTAITWRLAKMNLAIRGIAHNLGENSGSTFTDDMHKDKKVDFIMANPPFNLKKWRSEDKLKTDSRWAGYAVPPVANANYAWILHMLSKLNTQTGIAGFLLANGALNADGVEYQIRKQLLENDKIEAIIVLPRDMFYTTDISVTLWIMNNNKKARELNGRNLRNRENEVLFVDLRRYDSNVVEYVVDTVKKAKKRKVVFSDEQIQQIKKIYTSWQTGIDYENVPELCYGADLEEIRKQNYSLAPSKYIEFIDHDLEIDYNSEMKRIQAEMREILALEKQSQKSLSEAFGGIGYGID
ncbi:MAG: type I restriction-modification system subunit M [Oscillospiraceae bacterium]|jgi:type I restriction enzyme M protein|nr:type I restriction-modification system subunit M [Oscillospiraceae bacterium]